MADKHPLQAGDVTPDLSDYSFSNEADRRQNKVHAGVGEATQHAHFEDTAAGDTARPHPGRLFKVGTASPSDFLAAPFPVVRMDGDNNGTPGEVIELNIDRFGDGYDTTDVMRVRISNDWSMDTDNDGRLN
jgi:hypothetical protein